MPFEFDTLTEMPFGTPGRVFRSVMPFSSYDPERIILQRAIDQGVQTVITLTPWEEALIKTGVDLAAVLSQKSLTSIHLPIPDYGVPPDMDALQQAIRLALCSARQGKTLMVHCHAGLGRTGIFLGCMARQAMNLNGVQAIAWVRKRIPYALENQAQIEFVRSYPVEEEPLPC